MRKIFKKVLSGVLAAAIIITPAAFKGAKTVKVSGKSVSANKKLVKKSGVKVK